MVKLIAYLVWPESMKKILESKSKNFNNINSLIEYVKKNVKDPNLLDELSKLKKIDIKPDLDYLNRLV